MYILAQTINIYYLCTRKTEEVLITLRDGAVGSSLGS